MQTRFSVVVLFWCAIAATNGSRLLAQAPTGNPVLVPLKIWVVGEVKSELTYDWQMTLSGSFLPTQPGGSPPGPVTATGHDLQIVERMVTLNGVTCEPFRDYSLSFEAEGFWSGKFCVAAPPGYRVEIDGQPRNSELFDNSGGAIMWDAHPVVRIVPADAGLPKPAGSPTSFRTGLVDWRISLGALKDGSSAGEIALRGPGWDAAGLSAALDLTPPSSSEVYRGSYWDGSVYRTFYFSNETTVEFAPVGASSELRFYAPSQVSITGTYPNPYSITISGDPFVVYLIETPTSSSFRVTRFYDSYTWRLMAGLHLDRQRLDRAGRHDSDRGFRTGRRHNLQPHCRCQGAAA